MFCYFHPNQSIKYMVINQRKGIQALCSECKQVELNYDEKILKIEQFLFGLERMKEKVILQTQIQIQKARKIQDQLIENDVKLILENYIKEVTHFLMVLPYYNKVSIEIWAVIEGLLKKIINLNYEVKTYLQKILKTQSQNENVLDERLESEELQTLYQNEFEFNNYFDYTDYFKWQEEIYSIAFIESNQNQIVLGRRSKIEIWSFIKEKQTYQRDVVLETENTNITDLQSIKQFLIGSSDSNKTFVWIFTEEKWMLLHDLFDSRLLFKQVQRLETLFLLQEKCTKLAIIRDIYYMSGKKIIPLTSEITKECAEPSDLFVLCFGKIIQIYSCNRNFNIIQIIQNGHDVKNIQLLNQNQLIIQLENDNYFQIYQFNSSQLKFEIRQNINNLLLIKGSILRSLEIVRIKNYIILNYEGLINILQNNQGIFDNVCFYQLDNCQDIDLNTHHQIGKWNHKLGKFMIINLALIKK